MPTFLGFPISDDPASVANRATAKEGFIDSDERLLKELRVLIDEGGQSKRNPKLSADPQQIRDFLQWAIGDKNPPMPQLAVKLLCLKRASILSSTQSAHIGDKPRTGEKGRIAEIDALLKSTGVKDVNITNADQCKTIQSDKYVTPPSPPLSGSADSKGTGGCTTHVHCDNSAVVALLQEIMKKIECLGDMAPPSLEEATADLEVFKARLIALQENMDALHDRTPLTDVRDTGGKEPGPVDPTLGVVFHKDDSDDAENGSRGSRGSTGDPKSVQSANTSSIIRMLTNIQGSLGKATQQVSELPSNYKLVVNQLLQELNPTINNMMTDIRAQISKMDANVKEIKGNTTYIKTELSGLRENVRTLSSTHTHDDSTLTQLIDIVKQDTLSFQTSLNALQELTDTLSSYIGTLQRANGDGRNTRCISENEKLLTEIIELRKRLDPLLKHNADHETTIRNTVSKQEEDLERLRRECGKKDDEIADLKQRLKDCDGAVVKVVNAEEPADEVHMVKEPASPVPRFVLPNNYGSPNLPSTPSLRSTQSKRLNFAPVHPRRMSPTPMHREVMVEEPATEEPATEEPSTEEPATEEPTAKEPSAIVKRSIPPNDKRLARKGLKDSLIRAFGMGGESKAEKEKWTDLFNTILDDYESGIVGEEQVKQVQEFKTIETTSPVFKGITEALHKFTEGPSQKNYAEYIETLLGVFAGRTKQIVPAQGGTRRRKQKSQRRTRKL